MKNIFRLITSIVFCHAAGIIGSFFTMRSVNTWYTGINKPFFNPPDFVFAPVWITLYTLMGVSLFLVWRKGITDNGARNALSLFFLQLILNSSWSFAFFGCRSPLAGLIVIFILWTAIILTILFFRKISRLAAFLLVPYFIWVSFAFILNASIYFLNR